MNVLTIFDQRVSAIFEEEAPGVRQPISFKRLAKRAVREMEDETFVIDGVDTAPALYTVLVSQTDDVTMRTMYRRICEEIAQLIEAQAKKRGYTFVGRPLVRFMVDPGLRRGKYSVFAENIDPRTLARLRDEENTYLGITPPREVFVEQGFVPAPVPVHDEEPAPTAREVGAFVETEPAVQPQVPDFLAQPVAAHAASAEVGGTSGEPEEDIDPFTHIPEDYAAAVIRESAAEAAEAAESAQVIEAAEVAESSQVAELEDEGESAPPPQYVARHAAPAPESVSVLAPEPAAVPEMPEEPLPAPEPVAVSAYPSCTLTNPASGQVYHVSSERAAIGRERVTGGIVLTDPNVSRRHAELVFDGRVWHVRDLGSTNGTLVNDVDLPEAVLRDGDKLTIGLTVLEFRAG